MVSISYLTSEVFSLQIDTQDPNFTHSPGQHINIQKPDTDNLNIVRQYSIASCPARIIEILVKKEKGGQVSEYLGGLNGGDILRVKGPLGKHFILDQRPGLYIAGGVGVAPFLSFMRKNQKHLYTLLFSVRWERDIFLKNELLSSNSKIFLTKEEQSLPDKEDIIVYGRRINSEDISKAIKSFDAQPTIYICGSTRFVLGILDIINSTLNLNSKYIKTEMFG